MKEGETFILPLTSCVLGHENFPINKTGISKPIPLTLKDTNIRSVLISVGWPRAKCSLRLSLP